MTAEDKLKDELEWFELELEIGTLFDTAPVREEDLFAGRLTEVSRMLRAVVAPSKHVVLFGERGVGKSSLSNVFWKRYNLKLQSFIVARVQSGPHDTFSSLWIRALDELKAEGIGKDVPQYVNFNVDYETLTPTDIRRELAKCGANSLPIIIIDEYDKLTDRNAKELTANLIKELYDFATSTTIILVGVAEDIGELISDHKSLDRALVHIPLQRMSDTELREIVTGRLKRTRVGIDVEAIWTIIKLSRGLPYFTLELSKHAALIAIGEKSLEISNAHVAIAMDKFIDDGEVTFRDEYRVATQSNQANYFKQSLLACALAKPDEEGFFTATDVLGPFSSIMKENKQIAHFMGHLRRFSSKDGGNILIKRGGERQHKFRFSDPMMQPYVIIRGIKDQMVSEETRSALLQVEQPVML